MDFMKEASQIFEDDGLEMIGALLIMPDEEFDTLKGTILDAMREAANRKENQTHWSALTKQSGFTKERYIEELGKVDDLIEKEMSEYSETKKDFMRQFFAIIYNALIEPFDKNKRAIQIPIEICNPDTKIPTYAHDGDAGMDVYSTIDATIAPGETKLIPLGFKVAIPQGYELQVRPRSGFSLKTHLRVANAPGTIDSKQEASQWAA